VAHSCFRWKEGRVRRIAHSLAFALVLITLVACNSPIDKSDSTKAPEITPTSPAIRLRPPDFTIKGTTSTQAAIQGAYYWQLENGLAVDVKSEGFSVSGVTPMKVSQGEQLTVTASNGTYPESMDLKIYPEDGNLKEVKVTAVAGHAFVPTTEPITSQSFTNSPYDLKIDLPKGDYFIWMSGTWQNPFKRPASETTSKATPSGTPRPILPLTDKIAFWIQVD
jgi:hypothetical protein